MHNIYIDILFLQLPLYGLIIGSACGCWFSISRRQYLLALFFAAIAVLPFVSYLYSYVEARRIAPAARKAEVGAWQRVRITHDNKPRTFITTWNNFGGSIAKALVGLDRFEKAYGMVGDDWYSYERIAGSACIETQSDVLSITRQEARQSSACVSAAKIGRRFAVTPQIAEPHLRLLTDQTAPSHHESGGKVFAGDTLELRLVSNAGDQTRFVLGASPPRSGVSADMAEFREKGWAKQSFTADHVPHPEPIKFVLDALGDA